MRIVVLAALALLLCLTSPQPRVDALDSVQISTQQHFQSLKDVRLDYNQKVKKDTFKCTSSCKGGGSAVCYGTIAWCLARVCDAGIETFNCDLLKTAQ